VAEERSVRERVIEVIIEQIDPNHTVLRPGQITDDTSLTDLGADSLDAVELVMELEEEFDVNIPDTAADGVKTVGQIIAVVKDALEKSEVS